MSREIRLGADLVIERMVVEIDLALVAIGALLVVANRRRGHTTS